MNFIFVIVGVLIFNNRLEKSIHAYRYTMFDFNVKSLCNENNCGPTNNLSHTICMQKPSEQCGTLPFYPLKMPRDIKSKSLMGINGIRNRVANQFDIGNMNILHWDRYLALMADKSLLRCITANDPCNFLYSAEYPIGQTLNYSTDPPKQNVWYVTPIGSWYTEMFTSASEVPENIEDLKQQLKYYNNFPQLVWPTSEFVGCAAARHIRGYIMTCFFYPRGDIKDFSRVVLEGRPCTLCSTERPTCSRVFRGLCGLDRQLIFEDDSAVSLKFNTYISLLCFLALLTFKCLCLLLAE